MGTPVNPRGKGVAAEMVVMVVVAIAEGVILIRQVKVDPKKGGKVNSRKEAG